MSAPVDPVREPETNPTMRPPAAVTALTLKASGISAPGLLAVPFQ